MEQTQRRFAVLSLVAAATFVGPRQQGIAQLSPELIVSYSTFVGTHSGDDEVRALATDAAGNVYIAGYTSYDLRHSTEPGIPRRPGNLLIPHPTADNECYFGCGYVLKLDPQRQLVYGAVMYSMHINAIAVDAQQNVYFTGRTDVGQQFPWTPSSFDPISSSSPPNAWTPTAFVAKLDASGSGLQYASLFGATEGKGITVDSAGSAFVVGFARGPPGLATTPGTLRPAYQPTGDVFHTEGFLLKVNPSGAALDYGTYLGGSGEDDALAVALGPTGRVIVAGVSDSTDFVSAVPAGGSDGYIVEVEANGSAITRSRLLGGSVGDSALSVARDGTGGYLLAGATNSANFPVSAGVIQNRLMGPRDGWIARLDASLTPRYVTYFGGSYIDGVLSIVGDGFGNAYFAGVSFSADMLTTAGAFQDSTARVTDDQLAAAGRDYYRVSMREPREAYFGVLSADGTTLRHGTYLSGFFNAPRAFDALSIANAVTRTPAGTVYVGGSTDAESFPTTDGGFRPRMSGTADGFVTEWKSQSFRVSTESLLPVAEMDGAPYTARLDSSNGTAPVQWQVVGGFRLVEGLTLSPDGMIAGTARQAVDANGVSLTESGAYQFTVKATDATGAVAYKSFFLPTRFAGQPVCANGICATQGGIGAELPLFPPRIPNRGQPPFTLNVTGTLPPGISLDSNGEFRGRATTAGRYLVTLAVQDSGGRSVALTWDLNIINPNPAPAPTPSPTTTPAPPPSTGSSGGGGGGQIDALSTAVLALLLLTRAFAARVGPSLALRRPARAGAGRVGPARRRYARWKGSDSPGGSACR